MTSETLTKVSEQLHDYEMVVIISPEVAGDKIEARAESIKNMVTGMGGEVAQVDNWGKRKLAYPIKHSVEGNYVLFKFKMNPARGKELEANLRISEDTLRHLLIKKEVK